MPVCIYLCMHACLYVIQIHASTYSYMHVFIICCHTLHYYARAHTHTHTCTHIAHTYINIHVHTYIRTISAWRMRGSWSRARARARETIHSIHHATAIYRITMYIHIHAYTYMYIHTYAPLVLDVCVAVDVELERELERLYTPLLALLPYIALLLYAPLFPPFPHLFTVVLSRVWFAILL